MDEEVGAFFLGLVVGVLGIVMIIGFTSMISDSDEKKPSTEELTEMSMQVQIESLQLDLEKLGDK